jgi:UDP-N-acetylmuramoyl-tripeptide--D-alanyl-D-alanine ligase
VHLFPDKEQAATLVADMNKGDVVLVKASRSEKFEELAEKITDAWSEQSEKMADSE